MVQVFKNVLCFNQPALRSYSTRGFGFELRNTPVSIFCHSLVIPGPVQGDYSPEKRQRSQNIVQQFP